MKHGRAWAAWGLLLSGALLAGCAVGASDYRARFVRYESLQDGTRVALVAPVAGSPAPEKLQALTGLGDLRANDLVVIRDVGRSWDRPQWMPSAEVVRREETR